MAKKTVEKEKTAQDLWDAYDDKEKERIDNLAFAKIEKGDIDASIKSLENAIQSDAFFSPNFEVGYKLYSTFLKTVQDERKNNNQSDLDNIYESYEMEIAKKIAEFDYLRTKITIGIDKNQRQIRILKEAKDSNK